MEVEKPGVEQKLRIACDKDRNSLQVDLVHMVAADKVGCIAARVGAPWDQSFEGYRMVDDQVAEVEGGTEAAAVSVFEAQMPHRDLQSHHSPSAVLADTHSWVVE